MSNVMTDAREIIGEKYSLDQLSNLTSKTVLVTGANSPGGVGWHIAHQLAIRGAKVFLGARSLEKAQQGIEIMLEETPTLSQDNLKPFVADLGNLKSVHRAAAEFISTEDRLDVLVNNAGVLPGPLIIDEVQGISTNFATNHLGPFLLTNTLVPLMEKTALRQGETNDVRIVNVNSTSHVDAPKSSRYRGPEDFNNAYGDESNPMTPYFRYGYAKLANAIFSVELQRRFDSKEVPILVTYPHPGGVGTDGAANFLGGRDNDVFRAGFSPLEGAITPLFVAAHPGVREREGQFKGQYAIPWGRVKEGNPAARDEALATEMWGSSERVIQRTLGQ